MLHVQGVAWNVSSFLFMFLINGFVFRSSHCCDPLKKKKKNGNKRVCVFLCFNFLSD